VPLFLFAPSTYPKTGPHPATSTAYRELRTANCVPRTGQAFSGRWGIKIRDEGFVRNKAIYIALGVQADGTKEILGLWIEQTEGAKFWLKVMNDLKARGVEDVLRCAGPSPLWMV